METFGKFCVALIVIILSTLFSGFVFVKLYEWIVIPIYGLKPVSIAQAIGLSYFVSFLHLGITTNMASKDDKKDKDDSFFANLMAKIVVLAVIYTMYLGFGYVVSLYI